MKNVPVLTGGPNAGALLDAVVVSDFHLTSSACQVRILEGFLENLPPTRRLILNGDVLESTEGRLTRHHWRVLSLFRRMSAELELVWVRGNHDHDAGPIAHLIGATFVPEFRFTSGNKRFLAIHGDRWDAVVTDHPRLTFWANWAYLNLQRVSRSWAAAIKRRSKAFLRMVGRVKEGALAYGTRSGADVVLCGHTHHAEEGEKYLNTGCWTDQRCNYLTVANGAARLHEVEAGREEVAGGKVAPMREDVRAGIPPLGAYLRHGFEIERGGAVLPAK